MTLGIWSCLTKPVLLLTVNRPIRFSDGANSTDVAVTSSVSMSKECQSLLDRTNCLNK